MSAPATPSGKLLDVARITSAGETLGGFLSLADGLEESGWPKAAANDEVSDLVLDVEQAIDETDVRRFFQENCRVQMLVFKHKPPSNTQTRRVEVVLPTLTESLTPVANERTGRNAFRFPKVSLRDIGQLPEPANDPLPEPANDREWDEAA